MDQNKIVMSAMISLIYVLHELTDPILLGPFIAVTLITVFYAVLIRLLLMPIELGLRKRL